MLGDPITDLTIAMELNYFQLNSAEYFVPLAVKIPGSELVLAQKAGADRTVIDFIGEIKDEFGTHHHEHPRQGRDQAEGETASAPGVEPGAIRRGFTLFPGKYTIKFLARNAETGRIGTYQADFVVPNLNKELIRLPISSVVLSSQRVAMTDALFNAGKDKEAREQADESADRRRPEADPERDARVQRSRDLYIYLQAYERDAATMHPLAAFVTLLKGEEVVFESPAYTVTEGMDPKSKAVPFKLSLPLGPVEPGEYAFQITVLDPTVQKAAFWQAPVKIVP